MNLKKPQVDFNKVDTKEFEIPETMYERDIENQVFQGIVLKVLSKISGIGLIEDNFIESILGKTVIDSPRGILVEQDMKNNSISIRIEVNVEYGIPLPEKAEEIQTKVHEEITKLTGLHVALVHIIFKNLLKKNEGKILARAAINAKAPTIEEEYSDEF